MRNNGLVSRVGTWARQQPGARSSSTTSLSILLLFSLRLTESDKHSNQDSAPPSQNRTRRRVKRRSRRPSRFRWLQRVVVVVLKRQKNKNKKRLKIFFLSFFSFCVFSSPLFELYSLFNTSLIMDSSISRAQQSTACRRLAPQSAVRFFFRFNNILFCRRQSAQLKPLFFGPSNKKSTTIFTLHSQLRRLVHSINIYGFLRKAREKRNPT